MRLKSRDFLFFGLGLSTFLIFGAISTQKNDFLPQGFPILERSGFTVGYDSRNKIPCWVYEKITQKSVENIYQRKQMYFKVDPFLPDIQRSSPIDYVGEAYDRGHMCPAADVRGTKEGLKESFYLSNVCPQNRVLNRGFWRRLEQHARDLLKEAPEVHVYSGPLYLSQLGEDGKRRITYEVIGENQVAAPTHFFKIILAETKYGTVEEAFIVPNEGIDAQASFSQFSTTIKNIEKWSGFLFAHPLRK